jgi:hypothetical protein
VRGVVLPGVVGEQHGTRLYEPSAYDKGHTRHQADSYQVYVVRSQTQDQRLPGTDLRDLLQEDTALYVPFKKGESEFVLHRRRNTLAQIALEEHLRVTAYCMWSNSLLSFRFKPTDWTLYTFGITPRIQLIVSRQSCAMSAFVSRDQQCRTCAHPHWRAACEKPTFIRHIFPVSNARHQYDPSTRVRHAWCDQTLAPLVPLPIVANDLGPWRKRLPILPTCNVCV